MVSLSGQLWWRFKTFRSPHWLAVNAINSFEVYHFQLVLLFFYLNFIKSIELDIFPVQWFKFKHFMFFYVYHGQKCCFIVNSNSNAAIYNVMSCLRERMRVTLAASERMRATPWARMKKLKFYWSCTQGLICVAWKITFIMHITPIICASNMLIAWVSVILVRFKMYSDFYSLILNNQ